MRAIGKERFCCYTFLFCNGIIGIVVSILLAYPAKLELKGVWLGLIIGICINVVL